MLCHVLAEEGDRVWLAFRRPARDLPGTRQTTHYVVCSMGQAVLIDPGGIADFGPLLNAISEKIDLTKITAVIATQSSSYAIGSIGYWAEVLGPETPIYASELIAAELPHIDPDLNVQIVSESGGEVAMSDGTGLHMVPAPYLPSADSMTVYDPMARVLYTGDIGTAEGSWADDSTPFAERFAFVSHSMNAFHETWFASSRAIEDWMARIDGCDVEVVAPRAGPCLRGREVTHFKKWVAAMATGHLVENSEPSFLSDTAYAPDREQHDDVYDDERDALTFVAEQVDVEDAEDDYETVSSDDGAAELDDAEPVPTMAPSYDDEDDEEVSMLVDAVGADDGSDPYDGLQDGDDDADDFEIVYVDEDGNEIDPAELDDEDVVEEEEMLEGNDEIRLEFPPGKMFRLITRSDFDGLVCAVLLEELDLINDILFVHPNQMQEGEIEVSESDISTNLPYTPGIFASFDHHLSEITRVGKHYDNHIIDPLAPSAARVVYNYFGAEKRFPDISAEMMDAVDKGDSAQFDMDEVLEPGGWPLLNFIMDSRTGLGRYRGFRVPNYELMMSLIDYCRRYSIEDILKHPDVVERVDLYLEHQEPAKEQIRRCTTVHDNVAVLDLREEETIYVTNRFMIYALFPQCNISMHILWGRAQQNTVFAVGKSIFNKTSNTNIGDLMLTYGGGGHKNAGTCQSDNALSDVIRDALIQRMVADG